MDNYVINKIENKLRQFRLHSQMNYNDEKNEIYKKFPRLFELENKKRTLVSDITFLKEKNSSKLDELNEEIESFIKDNNITLPSKKYNCNICHDNGYINENGTQTRCRCFEKMLIEETIKSESLNATNSFDDYNESIFDEAVINRVSKIKNFLLDYSKVFPNVKKPNIFLSGNTGTGKTFLMSCVYYELKKRGIGALFISSGKMFDILRKYAFNQIPDIDVLLNAEILLIDDLGTEPMFNNITNEYLFLLVNERIRTQKPIFISTNLSPVEIKNHYNERIASRLLDKSITNIISLPGNDLRLR